MLTKFYFPIFLSHDISDCFTPTFIFYWINDSREICYSLEISTTFLLFKTKVFCAPKKIWSMNRTTFSSEPYPIVYPKKYLIRSEASKPEKQRTTHKHTNSCPIKTKWKEGGKGTKKQQKRGKGGRGGFNVGEGANGCLGHQQRSLGS